MTGHQEVMVWVQAWVDQGIETLVVALNEYEEIITVDSCQGGEGESAHVYFKHRRGAEELFKRAEWLARRIGKMVSDRWSLSVEWAGDGEEAMACLFCDPILIEQIARAVSRKVRI